MKNKKIFYSKILIILVLSFFISKLLSNEIYVANTPRIRPYLKEYLAFRLGIFIKGNISYFASIFNKEPNKSVGQNNISQKLDKLELDKIMANIPFKQLSKGIYAKETGDISYTMIKTDEVDWVVYTFNVKGREIKIKIPQGQQPPSQDVLEKMY